MQITLRDLHEEAIRRVDEAAAAYHEARGRLKLIEELIVKAQQQPVYTHGEDTPHAEPVTALPAAALAEPAHAGGNNGVASKHR